MSHIILLSFFAVCAIGTLLFWQEYRRESVTLCIGFTALVALVAVVLTLGAFPAAWGLTP